MIRFILITLLILQLTPAHGQLFGKNDIGLKFGIMTFHQKSLNNSANTNTRVSKLTEIDKRQILGRKTSFEYGIGYGSLQNLDNRFTTNQFSNFFRVKLGLIAHYPQQYTPTNWSPRPFNPYLKVAYNLDFFDKTYSEVNGKSLGSSLRLGIGFVVRLTHQFGLQYEFSHNQRVTKDYRTFYQHSIGLMINLDQIWLAQ
ncbi:MAG: hypothetical protein IT245_00305 [Bacteroidia bacterium]|nr:hypothetical protein [Bacteroidia bacterium]